jgi:hypothetical protein
MRSIVIGLAVLVAGCGPQPAEPTPTVSASTEAPAPTPTQSAAPTLDTAQLTEWAETAGCGLIDDHTPYPAALERLARVDAAVERALRVLARDTTPDLCWGASDAATITLYAPPDEARIGAFRPIGWIRGDTQHSSEWSALVIDAPSASVIDALKARNVRIGRERTRQVDWRGWFGFTPAQAEALGMPAEAAHVWASETSPVVIADYGQRTVLKCMIAENPIC